MEEGLAAFDMMARNVATYMPLIAPSEYEWEDADYGDYDDMPELEEANVVPPLIGQ